MDSQTELLNHDQVCAIVRRIAFQVAESHSQERELVLVGLNERGWFIAQIMHRELVQVLPHLQIHMQQVSSIGALKLNDEYTHQVQGKCAVIVDDVINSGHSVMGILSLYHQAGARIIQTAFLAEREYRSFPVTANWVGRSVATTLQDHVYFDNSNPQALRVYLAN